jgi:hypothetical protein
VSLVTPDENTGTRRPGLIKSGLEPHLPQSSSSQAQEMEKHVRAGTGRDQPQISLNGLGLQSTKEMSFPEKERAPT